MKIAVANNSTGQGNSYVWEVNGQQVSTKANPSGFTVSDWGTYTVTLTATNSGGSDSQSKQVTVQKPADTPTPDPTPVPDSDGDGVNDNNDACPGTPAEPPDDNPRDGCTDTPPTAAATESPSEQFAPFLISGAALAVVEVGRRKRRGN